MVNIANDNWFLDSSQPYLHFFMYQWRSLEFNLPVVRVGNGGASGVAYPYDVDHFRSDYPRKMNHMIVLKMYASDKTYYQRYGIYVVFFFASLLTLFGYIASLYCRKVSKN
jgi:apolipoprotein N-acyltransferase